MTSSRPLSVALVGAGPAGIYAADILSKSGLEVSIDLFERLPAPFGLVRYGVAPDHPRIKQIIVALYKILQRGDIRLVGNVDVGTDVSLEELQKHYDAVIFSTGSDRDAPLNIPGIDLPGSYGAADFVSWYDGHPDVPRTWPLEAQGGRRASAWATSPSTSHACSPSTSTTSWSPRSRPTSPRGCAAAR